jgi:hypothetical protein
MILNRDHNIFQKKSQFTRFLKSTRSATEEVQVHLKIYRLHPIVLDLEGISLNKHQILLKLQIYQDGLFQRLVGQLLKKRRQIEIKLMIRVQHLEPKHTPKKEPAPPATSAAPTEDILTNWVPLKI